MSTPDPRSPLSEHPGFDSVPWTELEAPEESFAVFVQSLLEEAHMLQSWDPFTVLAQLDEDFDELMRRTWGGANSGRLALGFVPPVDMSIDGKDVVIRIELPGIDVDKDVEIEVEGDRLTISGSRRQERSESTDDEMLVRELHQGSFWRQFELPSGVQPTDVTAKYERGILAVRVRDVVKRSKAHKVAIGKDEDKRQVTAKSSGPR